MAERRLHSFPEAGEIHPKIIDFCHVLRGTDSGRIIEFQPIHLFTLCWAFSIVGTLDNHLLAQITRSVLNQGDDLDVEGGVYPAASTLLVGPGMAG